MKKIIRLTESQLNEIIRRVITEDEEYIEPEVSTELGITQNDIDVAANTGTMPKEITSKLNPKELSSFKQTANTEILKPIDDFCKNRESQNIIPFLKKKLREFREKLKKSNQNKKPQVQEQFFIMGVGIVLAFAALIILIIRMFRGGDKCRKYSKWRNHHFSGYN